MEPIVSIESVLDALREVARACAGPGEGRALPVRRGPIDEVWVTLPAGCVRSAVQMLVQELEIRHLSTITASDLSAADPQSAEPKPADRRSGGLEVIYHFWLGYGLSLRCRLPYDDPRLQSVSDLIPGAAFYEREVAEMLGVVFDGHPDPGLLLLPDDWAGGAPLRYDYQPGEDL